MTIGKASKEQLIFFQNILLDWFESFGRNFPWRNKDLSQYEIIIAEILLQRTKADTIKNFFSQFIIAFPSWKKLVDTNIEGIEKALKPIGLYKQRAIRLQKLALEMENRGGVLPSKRDELESISLFGQYITNAIELQIFNRPKPLLDVNMARVLERYFGPRKLSDIRYDPYLQDLAHSIVNHEHSKFLSWAILDFAALICKARNPKCFDCPLQEKCLYFKWNILKID